MKTKGTVIGAGLVVVSLLLAAVPAAAGSKPLKPKKWAASFCDTIVGFRDDVTEIQNESLDLAGDLEAALTADPNAIFVYINDVATGLEDAAGVVTGAAEDIQGLRPPKVKGGGEIKAIIDDLLGGGLELIASEFQTAGSDLGAIDDATDDPLVAADELIATSTRIAETFTELGDTLSDSFQSLDDDPSLDPDDILLRALERSRACRPITG
jgi:hypothetical protein